jgi:aryl-alcohol dehydrogenase-like predicted oxidoreductase
MGSDPDRALESTTAVVRRALDLGVNYIDTAPLYGDSETLLGSALAETEQPYYLATKIGHDPPDFDYRRDSVVRSVERSLTRLRIEKLALVQIHDVDLPGWSRIMDAGYALEGLRAAQEQGLCDKIGITSRAIPLLSQLAEIGEFDSILVYHDYHPCSQLATESVIPSASAQGMGVVVATVLASGLLTGGKRTQQALDQMSEPERSQAAGIISRLSREPGTLPRNVFRYVLSDERVSTVPSGSADTSQLEDVVQASDEGPLPTELLDELASLSSTETGA